MAEPTHYRIKNWDDYQHYKDETRNPPWIKLHFAILASEDWVMLSDMNRVTMIACMLIGSRKKGCIPNNPEYIKRVANLNRTPDLQPLISVGFMEPVFDDASDYKRMIANESERSTREEKRRSDQSKRRDSDRFEQFWAAYPRKAGKARARDSFKKHSEHLEEMLVAIDAQKQTKQWQDQQFIPHPATWLNQERWLDEVRDLDGQHRGDTKDLAL